MGEMKGRMLLKPHKQGSSNSEGMFGLRIIEDWKGKEIYDLDLNWGKCIP